MQNLALLVIEDDVPTREVLTLLFEAEGWTVRGVGSGEAALELLRSEPAWPNVVLCDLHLPGVSGPGLAQLLCRAAPAATLLAMSASDPGDDAAGYAAALRKPFGPADVSAALAASPPAAPEALTATTERAPAADSSLEGIADLPVLSMPTFLKLEQQMGTRTHDLYAFALADAGDRLARMQQFVANGDLLPFRAEAHQLKGSAGMIGAERLASLAACAEKEDALSQRASPDKKLQEMHLACDEIRLMLKTLFSI